MRLIDWIMIIAVVIVAVAGRVIDFDSPPDDPSNPRRPRTEAFEPKLWDFQTQAWMSATPALSGTPSLAPLPALGVIEEGAEDRSSVGSAFSISERGLWLTARHVVAGCDKTYIQTGEKKYLRVQKTDIHPSADVALLATRGAPRALDLSSPSAIQTHAYGIGFPKGQPGAVHGTFMGELTMVHRGRQGYREQVNAWSERSRIPERKGSLGGLSGGALLDDQGRVIGIVQAESPRRGRFMTAKPQTINELLVRTSTALATPTRQDPEFAPGPASYPQTARQLITTLRVAKVMCLVE